ncbi:GNAT family N-acetyltransferase [Holdemania massiliensis]|uniref:GNAT family N-acetyltransferase n=1 Tax=Holdemania massiliensis TaxID=1468449 RepID=UPI001F05F140|nr:GNAT family N-acetyltransferase [Holdemania massiliensis]MCH1942283.1 GNAT family N-acetyltransferase [Holdemania massiliensis]
MKLEKVENKQIEKIVSMSKRAFETDVEVGGSFDGYPPEYDSVIWHEQMLKEDHLYQAVEGNKVVGGTILFLNENNNNLYIGRIFIDSVYHRKGYGISLMECIENFYPDVKEINLDTPLWNIRTNSFYKKLGYIEVKREDGFVFYQKKLK